MHTLFQRALVRTIDVRANNLKATNSISVRLFENRVIVFQSISNQQINICIMKKKLKNIILAWGLL